MRLIFITLLALMIAAGVGVGATWMTATRGTDLGTLTIGAWTARPKTGTADVDPYSRASIARISLKSSACSTTNFNWNGYAPIHSRITSG